jgi:hypothetical protein
MPCFSPALATRIRDALDIHTLEELEVTSRDGRLAVWLPVLRATTRSESLLWPQSIPAIGAHLIQSRRPVAVVAAADLALGLFLSYFGYVNA